MKFIVMASFCLFSLNSFSNANDHKEMEKMMDKMSLEDAKKMKLEMLDKKTTMIEQERKCISSAKDKPALKECMREMWKEHGDMKAEMKDKMKKNM
jgi:hypothetical protein